MEVFCLFVFKASKNKQELSFYSIPEFDEWKKHMENHKAWKIKYYKGLCEQISELHGSLKIHNKWVL